MLSLGGKGTQKSVNRQSSVTKTNFFCRNKLFLTRISHILLPYAQEIVPLPGIWFVPHTMKRELGASPRQSRCGIFRQSGPRCLPLDAHCALGRFRGQEESVRRPANADTTSKRSPRGLGQSWSNNIIINIKQHEKAFPSVRCARHGHGHTVLMQ